MSNDTPGPVRRPIPGSTLRPRERASVVVDTPLAPHPRRVRVAGDLWHGRVPEGAVYVGRQGRGLPRSDFANPFEMVKGYSRVEAVLAFTEWLYGDHPDLIAQAAEEIGLRPAACWCKPMDLCHANVLLRAVDRYRARAEQETTHAQP
jgi:hypothetical protein